LGASQSPSAPLQKDNRRVTDRLGRTKYSKKESYKGNVHRVKVRVSTQGELRGLCRFFIAAGNGSGKGDMDLTRAFLPRGAGDVGVDAPEEYGPKSGERNLSALRIAWKASGFMVNIGWPVTLDRSYTSKSRRRINSK
jgi:hypothetical protein